MKLDICYIIHNPEHTNRNPFIKNVADKLKNVSSELIVNHVWDKSGSELSSELLGNFKYEGVKSETHFKNAISLVMHHMKCLEMFMQTDAKIALILEDDSFVNNEQCLQETFVRIDGLSSFDSVYLGDGCLPNLYGNSPAKLEATPWSRCTEAILYTKEGAKKVLDYYHEKIDKKCCCPQLDFFFNNAYKEIQGYTNYHAHPAPMSQGTCKDMLLTTVSLV